MQQHKSPRITVNKFLFRIILVKFILAYLVKKILYILRKPKVHYHVQKSPSLDPILSQMNEAHTFTLYFFLRTI
jgi:hypothetical protein